MQKFLFDLSWSLLGVTHKGLGMMVLGLFLALVFYRVATRKVHIWLPMSEEIGTALAPLGVVIFLGAAAVADHPRIACYLEAELDPRVVFRAYGGGSLSATPSDHRFELQESFAQFEIKLTSLFGAEEVAFTLRGVEEDDRLESIPGVTISDMQAGWMSGFSEPSRRPDFQFRTIELDRVDSSTKIRLRRPFDSKDVLQLTPPRISDLRAGRCNVIPPAAIDWDTTRSRLESQWKGVQEHWFPLGEAPPDVRPGEIEMVAEFVCRDEACRNITASRIEGRSGSPAPGLRFELRKRPRP